MKIGINARFLIHPTTGIGQYTRNLLQALAKLDQKNEYFLFTPESAELDLPESFHQIRVRESSSYSPGFAKAHWEHTLVPQEMKKLGVQLAHFLYPANPWARLPIPTVVTVHDAIPWRLPAYRHRRGRADGSGGIVSARSSPAGGGRLPVSTWRVQCQRS